MLTRAATLACLVLPLGACAALRGDGDPCAVDDACPWGQSCCLPSDCSVDDCVGTCRADCATTTPAAECEQDNECNDDNPCTTDSCAESSCANEPVDEGQECETAAGTGGHCTAKIGSTDEALICLAAVGDPCHENTDCGNDNCMCVDPECVFHECSQSQCSVCEFAHPIDGCTNMPDGASAPECAPFVCNEGQGGCLSTCDGNEDCAPGTRCFDEQCVDCADTPGWCLMHRDREAIYKSVWALSPTDVWVVGQRHGGGPEPRPTIFRWQNGRRSIVHQRSAHGIFHDVWADATTVWAVGEVDLPSRLPLAVRWNGDNWAQDPPLPAEDIGLRSVWSVGSVVFAVGTNGTVLRNDGFWLRDWTTFRPIASTLLAVWGESADAMWAGGIDLTDGDDLSAHLYEGSGFDAWSFHDQLGFAGAGVAVHDMWGSANGTVWAVGGLPAEVGVGGLPFVAAWDGIGWDDGSQTLPLADITLLGVWADDGHVWAVGSAPGQAGVYERRDGVWGPHQIDWPVEPTAVSSSQGIVWLTDERGSLFRYLPPPP